MVADAELLLLNSMQLCLVKRKHPFGWAWSTLSGGQSGVLANGENWAQLRLSVFHRENQTTVRFLTKPATFARPIQFPESPLNAPAAI